MILWILKPNRIWPYFNAMTKKSIGLIGFIILSCNAAHGDDSACRLFYSKLSELPHSKLTVNTDRFISLWDGKNINGCEVIFETDESMVTGEVVHKKFESLINLGGWSLNEKSMADGPGSSTINIENDGNRCLINWSQSSWVDEKTDEIKQSDKIKIVVQCSTLPTKN